MEVISSLLALYARISPVTGEFPPQKLVTRSFDGFLFFVVCAWKNGLLSNCEAGDLRLHRAHYDVTVMLIDINV